MNIWERQEMQVVNPTDCFLNYCFFRKNLCVCICTHSYTPTEQLREGFRIYLYTLWQAVCLTGEKLIHAGRCWLCCQLGEGNFRCISIIKQEKYMAVTVWFKICIYVFKFKMYLNVNALGSTAGVTVRFEIRICSLIIAVTIESFSNQSHSCDSNAKSRRCTEKQN